MNLDAYIDNLLSPIADKISGIIFSSITIKGVEEGTTTITVKDKNNNNGNINVTVTAADEEGNVSYYKCPQNLIMFFELIL